MIIPNGANILLLIRDRKATNLRALCRHFRIKADSPLAWYVIRDLEELQREGLISARPKPSNPSKWADAELETTSRLAEIQETLGFSLRHAATATPDSITVNPQFGRPRSLPERCDIFVLMPFSPELQPIYQFLVKVCSPLKLVVRRADDFFTANHVMADVWNGIWSARILVADCTGRNPNVFYEIGVAHTIGRPVILITQRESDIPFDLRHIRYIPYDRTARGMRDFSRKLTSTLRDELSLVKRSSSSPARGSRRVGRTPTARATERRSS